MYGNHYPHQRRGLGAVSSGLLLLGGLYAAGGIVSRMFDEVPDCIFPNPFSCAAELSEDHPQKTEYGGMDVVAEEVSGTASYITYGEVRVSVDGEQSTADFDNPDWWEDFAGDVDATMYAFSEEGQVMTLVYNPCIKKSDDYSGTTTDINPSEDKNSVGGEQPAGSPSGSLSYEVAFHQSGPEVGTVQSVSVDAGILDACFMRIEETPENAAVFNYDNDNQTQFGDAQDITFRYDVRKLATLYAASEACPENVIDLEAVRDDLARTALGDMSAEHPEQATLFANAYNQGLFEVSVDGPENRRVLRTAEFNEFIAEVKARDETLPDAQGNTWGMITPEFGNFVVGSCGQTVQPFEVVGTSE